MAKWKVKTGKADGFLELGYKTKVYRGGKLMGEGLANTRKESRERALDRAIKKAAEKRKK